jgi:hypothetical protein
MIQVVEAALQSIENAEPNSYRTNVNINYFVGSRIEWLQFSEASLKEPRMFQKWQQLWRNTRRKWRRSRVPRSWLVSNRQTDNFLKPKLISQVIVENTCASGSAAEAIHEQQVSSRSASRDHYPASGYWQSRENQLSFGAYFYLRGDGRTGAGTDPLYNCDSANVEDCQSKWILRIKMIKGKERRI